MGFLVNEKSEDFALEETPCSVSDSPVEFMGLVLFQGVKLPLKYK